MYPEYSVTYVPVRSIPLAISHSKSASFENYHWISAFDMYDNLVKAGDLVYKPYFPAHIFNCKEANGTGAVRAYLSYILGRHFHAPSQSHPFNATIILYDHTMRYP
jgi:hypothetical protein